MKIVTLSQTRYRRAKQQALANSPDPACVVLSTTRKEDRVHGTVQQKNELRLFKYYGYSYVGILFTFVKKTHESSKTPVKVFLKENEEVDFDAVLETALRLATCSCKTPCKECHCKK